MEIKKMLISNKIIGIVGNYRSTFNFSGYVRDLKIKNIENALRMVDLNNQVMDKKFDELNFRELWKLELASKLDNEVIIVGNLYKNLIHKDIEYVKKLFLKLSQNYHKKIIVIDKNVLTFMGITKTIIVIKNKKVEYITNDFYDDKLYLYTKMPKIVEFIKYINEKNHNIKEHLDIYELIKDIYRSVS